MLNRCYIKLSLVNILEMFFVFIEILFKMLLFKGGVLIYAEHCIYIYKTSMDYIWLSLTPSDVDVVCIIWFLWLFGICIVNLFLLMLKGQST